LTIAKRPTSISTRWSGRLSGTGGFGSEPETKFVTIDPGKSHRFRVGKLPQGYVVDGIAHSSLEIDLAFMSNGNQVGVNAWIGVLYWKAAAP
jgi:hypothetical protein